MKLNEITAMATLHRYKRGHTPRIQKGLKRPTLAWNEIPFVTNTFADIEVLDICHHEVSMLNKTIFWHVLHAVKRHIHKFG